MSLLATIKSPEDLKRLPRDQLPELAEEVRERLIECVAVTGGHIGASLGVVELAIALLYEFDSPRDKIVWDVGHQAYAWKLLTGRNDTFPTLRQTGGISGFLKRSESEHDQFGAGHAGTAMSAALGMATARDLKGEDFKVVAVVGDGALTCGLCYEGMNNAGHSDRDIILIVNDNGMSISPNVGAISRILGGIVARPITNRFREHIKHLTLRLSGVFGEGVVEFAKNLEESAKNLFSEGMLFEELGFRYFGPIDGHDLKKLTETFAFVRGLTGPRVIHVITEKGKGFTFAESNREKWHGLAAYDPVTGEARKKASAARRPGPRSSATALTALAAEHPDFVVDHRRDAVAAPAPTSSRRSGPARFFDVGIAEGHAVTFAGGLATQGVRPVVGDLQHLPAAGLRQHHPRHRGAAPAGDLLHGPGGAGGRGRPDPHGAVRHRLHAGGARHDRHRAQGRRRADRAAQDRAGPRRRPVLHPLPARQGARRAAAR